eukprot:c11023_g1_i2.p1 GENE.c11023_g1_i2~~c11023_g1_i2.p1  ORF type:complete len:341 (+),score=94.82 c11023_g1_i2:556-1578(+)
MWIGCLLTALDTFLVLIVLARGVRVLEAVFLGLVAIMAFCFIIQFANCEPDFKKIVEGTFIPLEIQEGDWDLVAAILGATVMTHNLFLHSHLVQTRNVERGNKEKLDEALSFFSLEFAVSMVIAFLINMSILIVFAARFYPSEGTTGLERAGEALEGQLGKFAGVLWGIGILAAGQASTMTGTYAGQFVMEGFLNIQISAFKRVLFTRSVALVPAMFVSAFFTQRDINALDSFVNIMQAFVLPFAIVPVLRFVSSERIMGPYAIKFPMMAVWWAVGGLIMATNIVTTVLELTSAGHDAVWIVLATLAAVAYFFFLFKVTSLPFDLTVIGERERLVGEHAS